MSDEVARELNDFGKARLPGMLGLEILSCSADRVTGRIPITDPLIAGTGFVWAPVVLALAYTTQVWDATVSSEKTGKTIALFRCTQLVLW